MKKILCFLVCLCLLCSVAIAGIDTSWNTVKKPRGSLSFNVSVGTAEKPNYYPLQIRLYVLIITSDGEGKRKVTKIYNVGKNRNTPFVFSTTKGLKEVYDALPLWAKTAFKDAVLEGINEDASVQ